jgi:[ribosomal protein S5]-alanine N-acetyltransferase
MNKIIETERLLLRKTELRDATTFVEELNNFNIVRNTARVPYPYHRSDALEFLQFASCVNERSCVAAVELKSQPDALIGVISYEWSEAKQDAELGYWLTEKVWGQGIGTEAAFAAVEHAFVVKSHTRLVACYHNDNPASARILSRLGFIKTGVCSNFSKAQGRDVEVTTVELRKSDWLNKKSRRLSGGFQ